MGRIWMPGGAGGTDLDVVTAAAGDVLEGKVIVGPDGEPLTGTLVKQEAYTNPICFNTGKTPSLENNLYVQIPKGAYLIDSQSGNPEILLENVFQEEVEVTPSFDDQLIEADPGKLLKRVFVNAISGNYYFYQTINKSETIDASDPYDTNGEKLKYEIFGGGGVNIIVPNGRPDIVFFKASIYWTNGSLRDTVSSNINLSDTNESQISMVDSNWAQFEIYVQADINFSTKSIDVFVSYLKCTKPSYNTCMYRLELTVYGCVYSNNPW